MKRLKDINLEPRNPLDSFELEVNLCFDNMKIKLGAHKFTNKTSNSCLQNTFSAESNFPPVFVIIAFSPDMNPIFEGIRAAGEKNNLKVKRVLDVDKDYVITKKIEQMIRRARLIVADLTHGRPNVYFELGFARAIRKNIITIAREGTELAFDVKDRTCRFYNDSRVIEEYLTKRFAQEKSSLTN